MKRPLALALGLAVALAGHGRGARADPIPSDRLLVTNLSTGAVLYDATTSASGPGGSEGPLFFAVLAPPSGPTLHSAVILTEPAGEPLEEDPIFVPGTDRVASDIVGFNRAIDVFGQNMVVEVFLLSDGYSAFESALNFYVQYATLLEETGELQDLTSLLQSDVAGWRVEVQSDVIPEPATLLLLGTGLAGIAAMARHRRATT